MGSVALVVLSSHWRRWIRGIRRLLVHSNGEWLGYLGGRACSSFLKNKKISVLNLKKVYQYFSSIQNLINKKKAVAAAPVAGQIIATISNAQAPGSFQPGGYLTAISKVLNSSNGQVSACSANLTTQTAPYTFMNGTFNFLSHLPRARV